MRVFQVFDDLGVGRFFAAGLVEMGELVRCQCRAMREFDSAAVCWWVCLNKFHDDRDSCDVVSAMGTPAIGSALVFWWTWWRTHAVASMTIMQMG